MENRIVKNFQIKELIATGGMASIYKATQISLDRTVVLKLLHSHLTQDRNFIARFEREAKATANLNHENIVSVIDYGESDGAYFIAMEYVEGKDLNWAISTLKCLPLCRALAIVYEICQGLYYAHKKGVVHRDIKPSNILIGYDGVPKITDFGVAQIRHLDSLTLTDSLMGTPAYMSPEQAAGRKVDERADIFSLGIILYEMIAGKRPFPGDTYTGIILKILTEPPAPLSEIKPELSPEVSAIAGKMLEKDRDNRYSSAFEVGSDILSYFRQKRYELSRKEIADLVVGTDARPPHTALEERRSVGAPSSQCPVTPHDEPAVREVKKLFIARKESFQVFLKKALRASGIAVVAAAATFLVLVLGKVPGVAPGEKSPAEEKTKKADTAVVNSSHAGAAVTKEIITEARRKAPSKKAVPLNVTQMKETKVQLSAATPLNGFSSLKIKVEPWADIYLDNGYIETTPVARPLRILPGTHTVTLKNPNYKSWQRMITFKPGDTCSVDVKLEPQEGR
ncbi:MAG: serine/threonine protein kinase [Chitinispirillaceae bacterium]|nr:serine/threonine protein kinase [Chitinispirillaceae bacterium]